MPNEIKWENNVLGFVPREDWLSIPFNPTRQGDPADALFGDLKTDNIAAKWQSLNAQYQIPVMAQFHSFDVESQTTVRVPVDTHNIEKGLIKVKINQSERMRALLRAGVQNDQMYDYVINDGVNLAEQIITRTKVAKNELLATGKVTIKENNLDLTVDYGVPASQTGFVIDLGKDADIMGQIQTIIDQAKAAGVILNGLITSQANLTKMRKNTSMQTIIGGNIAAGGLLRLTALKDFLAEEFGLVNIIVNDLTYAAERTEKDGTVSQTIKRYYPENKITFFAQVNGGKLGTGLWGDAPEVDAANLMNVGGSAVSPYVAISQWTENDPAVMWTKASALFMPLLFNPNSLWIAEVADNFFTPLTVSAMSRESIWGHTVSDLQSGITVAGDKITGTLKYCNSGQLVTDWGPGYFLCLKWTDPDDAATSLKVGLVPSEGTGMVEAIQDTDRDGVFKITSKEVQKFTLIVSNTAHATVQSFDLSGLTLSRT